MTTTIIFSFNRAMQLELLLESISKYDISKQLDLNVVYATTSNDFEKGYEMLRIKFPTIQWHKETSFDEQLVWPIFPPYWRNYYWWLKYKYSRSVSSNFIQLVLSVLQKSSNASVMFLTDDSMFVSPICIQTGFLNKVEKNGLKNSYSLRHGKNLFGGNYTEIVDGIEWSIFDKHDHPEWSYPFSVDGHIYNKEILLKIFQKVWFKNPNTLEGNMATYVKDKKLFSLMTANKQGSLLGFELNRVQTISDNNNLDISNETMNELYLNGYQLEMKYELLDTHLFRPELVEVLAVKNDDIITLYEQKK